MANLFKQKLKLPDAAVAPSVVKAAFVWGEQLITKTFKVIRVRIDYGSAT